MPSVWRHLCTRFCRDRGASPTRMCRRSSGHSAHLREEFLRGCKVLPRRLGGHRGRGAPYRSRIDFRTPCRQNARTRQVRWIACRRAARIRRRCGLCSCGFYRGLGDQRRCSRRTGQRSLLLFRRFCLRDHRVRHGGLWIGSLFLRLSRRHGLGAAPPLPHIERVLVFYGEVRQKRNWSLGRCRRCRGCRPSRQHVFLSLGPRCGALFFTFSGWLRLGDRQPIPSSRRHLW